LFCFEFSDSFQGPTALEEKLKVVLGSLKID